MATASETLKQLIETGEAVDPKANRLSSDYSNNKISSDEWLNDVTIFTSKYLTGSPLYKRINDLLFHRPKTVLADVLNCLRSVYKDNDFLYEIDVVPMSKVPTYKAKGLPEYDVFISHANRDKENLVEELNTSLKKLGVNIFYDKETFEWGDNWKEKIYEGTKKSEFAIIVISENYFGREWTEKELNNFLNRQNRNGQKLILPILHNITIEQLKEKYPNVADIQAIDSSKYNCDQIALLFARQLIKRLKSI